MKALSVKMKVTFWYTGLIVVILGVIFGTILFVTDEVLLLSLQNKLENEVYDCAEDLIADKRDGHLLLEKIEFLNDGIMLAIYNDKENFVAGLQPQGLPETQLRSEVLRTVKGNAQNWYLYDFYYKPKNLDTYYWVRGTVSLSSVYTARDNILWQCALLFPFLIFLAGAGGYFITTKAFKPIAKITQTAEDIGSGNDLSKRINLEGADEEISVLSQTFDRMFARLEELFARERQFSADASHELRTPVSVIMAQVEYGISQPGEEEKQAALTAILKQAKKMSKLIGQLLLLSRNNKEAILEKEKLDFSEMTEMIIEEIRISAASKHIRILSEIEPNLQIIGDQTLLMRMLLNLLDNAIKYGREGGWIKIFVEKGHGRVVVSIADNGIGISELEQSKIWKRFYQVDNARDYEYEGGAGLGLAMVQWIVEQHGGTIRVDSMLGKGSSFSFSLPLA